MSEKNPEKRPIAMEIEEIFKEWQNNEFFLSELTKSEAILINTYEQIYSETLYESSQIAYGEGNRKSIKKTNISAKVLALSLTLEYLTKLLEIEPYGTLALKYQRAIYFMIDRCEETLIDLNRLLEFKLYDTFSLRN
ncbi:hypothetical protein C2G38_2217517 [Gigaspora rosea]|uniref:Uncharacterized protein n=1 Tax=Gigaspora rosea TaxID=44941 RepID=A0A397U7N0_9GLOM|nr:hypothetical protein C2G38_2217517 [Gigaspora rosea]